METQRLVIPRHRTNVTDLKVNDMETQHTELVWQRLESIATVSGLSTEKLTLLDLRRNQPISISGTGLDIWNCIDGIKSEREIIMILSRKYGISYYQISEGVKSYLRNLASMDLINRM